MCGQENLDEARFCDACGTRLVHPCPECGADLRPNLRFCVSCGSLVEPPVPTVASTVVFSTDPLAQADLVDLPPAAPQPLPATVAETRPARRDIAAAEASEDFVLQRLPVDDAAMPAPTATVPGAPAPARPPESGFVGRDRELGALRAALDAAVEGRGAVMLLGAPAGAGKTRLLAELAREGRQRGAIVLAGRAQPVAPPFDPWNQVVDGYMRARGVAAAGAEMGPGAAVLARSLPVVSERLPGLPPPPSDEPREARARLFEVLATFLHDAARTTPLVLVLDDLDRGDPASLLMLRHLSGDVRRMRVLAVGAYDDGGLSHRHPLTPLLAEPVHDNADRPLHLSPLTKEETGRLVTGIAGVPLPDGLVAALHEASGGNPLLVEETVRLLAAEGVLERPAEVAARLGLLPRGLREVAGRRVDALSRDAGTVLTAASVAGADFSAESLAAMTGSDAGRVDRSLWEAAAAGIIEDADRAGRYRFHHEVFRSALAGDLSSAARLRMHHRAAAAIERAAPVQPGADAVCALAFHAIEAGPLDIHRGIAGARRAAATAAAMLGFEQAAAWAERALELLELVEPPDDGQRADLMLALADARRNAGDVAGARAVLRDTVESARRAGPVPLARTALAYRALGSTAADDTPVTELLREAAAGLGDDDPLRTTVEAELSREPVAPPAEPAAPAETQPAPRQRGADTIKWHRPT